MHWRRLIYTSMLAIAVCACLSLEAVSVTRVGRRPRPGQTARQRVDELFSGFDRDTPGAAVGVVHKGQVVFQGGYGSADLRKKTPVDSDTAFHLASCGKEMTAVAILLLVQSLRDSPSSYPNPSNRRISAFRPSGRGIDFPVS